MCHWTGPALLTFSDVNTSIANEGTLTIPENKLHCNRGWQNYCLSDITTVKPKKKTRKPVHKWWWSYNERGFGRTFMRLNRTCILFSAHQVIYQVIDQGNNGPPWSILILIQISLFSSVLSQNIYKILLKVSFH